MPILRRLRARPGTGPPEACLPGQGAPGTGSRTRGARAELTDELWAAIGPLMPQATGPSRPDRDHRQVVEGIVHPYRCGLARRDLPEPHTLVLLPRSPRGHVRTDRRRASQSGCPDVGTDR
ncbi:transposase [Streptomyces sp.]|uniref:transposase n=1 Tax=Streptomyces sp. TaxID=1931 RepID=UPI0039C9706D